MVKVAHIKHIEVAPILGEHIVLIIRVRIERIGVIILRHIKLECAIQGGQIISIQTKHINIKLMAILCTK